MNTDAIVTVHDLTKHYDGVAAIEAVSFSIHKGEVVGFVGLNGAGKSTTINLMLGFLRATRGTVTLFGRTVLPETAHTTHRRIGFTSGDMSLFTNLTGSQYLRFVAGRFGMRDNTRLGELSAMFDPQLNKKIGDLSRGNKQKIALIAAFMASPELVILDEPSSGLDPLMQQTFVNLIRQESQKGTTIFMSSHYLNEVLDVCSRILLIQNGQLIKDIPSDALLTGGGKAVRLVSRYEIQPPSDAQEVTRLEHPQGFEVSFVYRASAAKLQQWLGGIPQLIDLSITDHTVEEAFDDLYALETKGQKHA